MRGPRNGLKIRPRSSGGVSSAPCSAQMPNVPTKRAGGHTGGASRGVWGGAEPTPWGRLLITLLYLRCLKA
eukprot:7424602-Alexandrium_andersonii.AAC.1